MTFKHVTILINCLHIFVGLGFMYKGLLNSSIKEFLVGGAFFLFALFMVKTSRRILGPLKQPKKGQQNGTNT